LEKGNLTKAVF